ncbi:hypothetical protein GXW71_06545 [Roseomonas hellenica]|uniref:Uncharacterized protein n=1 Tax=Plastoroseomonas hellenica TaxID=2687306 RepID=A0ABS5EUP7_9PROT|nr:hypothetical protein [Plastoroseomonas hellenica]MBR0664012.1 hypothetical protein [Plastoroseomonas hellenica]
MKQKPEKPPALVPVLAVFGILKKGKSAVGARFAIGEIRIARWVKENLHTSILIASSEAAISVVTQLRPWTLKADGMPALHIISTTLWESLREAAQKEVVDDTRLDPSDAGGKDTITLSRKRQLLEELSGLTREGDEVLAPDLDSNGFVAGWWPATLLHIASGIATLYWTDEPEEGLRQRRLDELVAFVRTVKPASEGPSR